MHDPSAPLLTLAVGNTRARIGLFRGRELHDPVSIALDDSARLAAAASTLTETAPDAVAVVSSVNPAKSDAIISALSALGLDVLRVDADVPVPIAMALDDHSTLGQDRRLCALAASRRAEQACVVVDAGTAITVDFVDGEGTFQGGVIAPGLTMMLRALHQGTAQLPSLTFAAPDATRGPFGKDTRHAMLLGVMNAARGLVRETVEKFAEQYQAYPQIIATGGDAPTLFEHDGLVEHLVPDLQLMGIMESWRSLVGADEAEPGPDDDADE